MSTTRTGASGSGPVLVCYDGSAESDSALDVALSVFGPREVVVVTAWQSLQTELAESGAIALATGGGPVFSGGAADGHGDDARHQDLAHDLMLAAERRARAAGRTVITRVEQADAAVWQTLLEVAEEIDAPVVVTGTRGRGALASAILGSVSRELLAHSHRPVLVVPAAPHTTTDFLPPVI